MADIYERRQGHELGVQDTDPWWHVGDQPPRQSVALWLADHAGLPPVEYSENDLFQPPSALVEFRPATSESRPSASASELSA